MCGSVKLVFWVAIVQWLVLSAVLVVGQGSWQLLQKNAGIASMHSAVTRFDQVIFLDRTNIGPSQIRLPNGRCRQLPLERISKTDCYAHSVMFNPSIGNVRPLFIYTDTWCSSGQFMGNGVMVQTGGDFEGSTKIRTLAPCGATGSCDWVETTQVLARGRWYASNQVLPGGTRQIVVGGRVEPTYEFVPKRKSGEGSFGLNVLNGCCDNLYPFVFLLPTGDVFIFANRDSVILNWNSGKVVKKLPSIPGNPRNYPSAGSAALLPLKAPYNTVEVMVCGGAATGASETSNTAAPASATCGRIVPTAGNAKWAMENMPIRRTMGDMINVPTGEIMIINGAQNGYQGWAKARNPVLNPIKYNGDASPSKRFQVMAKTNIARVYHSTANLLSDGRILVAGSDTHQYYTYIGAFPTELRVEAFSPPYMASTFNKHRPRITKAPDYIGYNQVFEVVFTVTSRAGGVECSMLSAPFSTHSYAQGQRALKLKTSSPNKLGKAWAVKCTAPPSDKVAPQQYYMLFIVQNGIPGKASWVKMG